MAQCEQRTQQQNETMRILAFFWESLPFFSVLIRRKEIFKDTNLFIRNFEFERRKYTTFLKVFVRNIHFSNFFVVPKGRTVICSP
jgi:hypothetical protein